MTARIEDYALIGDCQTAALVSRGGSIDWLCLPRFDSAACFAALLGGPDNGRWLLAPHAEATRVERAYRKGTLVLDTTFSVGRAAAMVSDCMPMRGKVPRLVRVVRGLRGRVRMQTELIVRFDYGSFVPWVRQQDGGLAVIAGPDALRIQSEVPLRGEGLTTVADFEVGEGQSIGFVLTWYPSHATRPKDIDAGESIAGACDEWRTWSSQCTYEGEWYDLVERSLITLKALTHTATGGIVAAPTTSLPEALGGTRNWDYRYCWVRDATFTLLALLQNGFRHEAEAWREWLLRAAGGDPSKLQILYAVDGGRRAPEQELPWLPGYAQSHPVRIGNAAYEQRQLDVYGEVIDAMYQCHVCGLPPNPDGWNLARALLESLESRWDQPDDGIWEVRGPRRNFTHSKVMAWVAFDRAVKRLESGDHDGPLERWRALREQIKSEICLRGFDPEMGAFVQYYGAKALDASLLMIPLVGLLPATDSRVRGTVRAIESSLMEDGLVRRYDNRRDVDGLPPGEGLFLPCSFWLVDNLHLMGRHDEGKRMFERIVSLANDVGLLSEEYDPRTRRLLGNFPQAFCHISLVNSARNLSPHQAGPAHLRRGAAEART